MTTTTVSCPAPESLPCSGRGNCTASADWCECPRLWTGQGDLVFGGPSCAISEPAIQALHSALLLVALRCLFLAVQYWRDQRAAKARAVKDRRATKAKYPMLDAAITWSFIVVAVGFIVYSCYRIANPLAAMGTDVAATAILTFSITCHNLMGLLLNYRFMIFGFLHQSVTESSEIAKLTRSMWIFCAICVFLLVANGTLFILMPIFNSAEAFDVLVPLKLALNVVYVVFHGSVYLTIFHTIEASIIKRIGEKAKTSQILAEILREFRALKTSAGFTCILIGILTIPFAAWKGLRIVAYPYVLPTHWILALGLQGKANEVFHTWTAAGEAKDADDVHVESVRAMMATSTRPMDSSAVTYSPCDFENQHAVKETVTMI